MLLLPITLSYVLWNLTLTNKLLVNDKITASCPTKILPKPVRLAVFQNLTILLRVNLLQVCPSLPTLFCALLFIPSFDVLSDYFDVSLNFFAVPTVRISTNFVTAPSMRLSNNKMTGLLSEP